MLQTSDLLLEVENLKKSFCNVFLNNGLSSCFILASISLRNLAQRYSIRFCDNKVAVRGRKLLHFTFVYMLYCLLIAKTGC